jgi:ATP-binding cassette subfamily C (CFTR/MRP) protein 1
MVQYSILFPAGPVQILICLVEIYLTVGVSMLAGLAVLLVCIPVNFWATRRGEERLDLQLAAKDRRVKLMSEILSGIKVKNLIRGGGT